MDGFLEKSKKKEMDDVTKAYSDLVRKVMKGDLNMTFEQVYEAFLRLSPGFQNDKVFLVQV